MKLNRDTQNFIVAKIQYVTTRCLVDSGAAKSCVSAKFVKKLHLTPTPLKSGEPQVLFTANKSSMRNLGTVELNVCVQGLVIPYNFCVLSELNYPVILGFDFLTTAQADINCYEKVISFYQGLVTTNLISNRSEETIMLLSQSVEIPANSEAILPIHTTQMCANRNYLLESWAPIKNKLIAVAPALVRPENGSTCCRVLNLASTPRKLAKNAPIAIISAINEEDQHNCNILRQNSKFRQGDQIFSLLQGADLTHSQKFEYLQKIGIPFKDTKLNDEQMEKLVNLLYKYKHIFAESYTQLPGSDLIQHEIKVTSEKPIRQRYYRLAPFLERELQRQCDELEKCGIIEKSESPWSSPTFLIKKPDNTYRKVIDLRAVNKVCEPMYLSLPSIDNCMDLIGQENPSFFSLCDQKNGFWSLKVHPNSRKYLGFSTSQSHYQYARLPMGLRNSPIVYFQALSRLLHSELASKAVLYLDDLILFTASFEAHLQLIETVMAKFDSAKLRLNPKKCRFCVDSLIFLGFRLDKTGVSIDPSRFEAIKSYPVPTNVKQLRQFLGLILYFKKFIRGHSKITESLRRLLQKNTEFKWGEEQQTSFNRLKEEILKETVLIYPRPDQEFTIWLDASSQALAFALSQRCPDGKDRFISFNGRATRSWERSYSAALLEVSALAEALKTYHPYIGAAKHFVVKTDHLSLKYLQQLKLGPSRLIRYAVLFAPYNFTVQHISGEKNQLCDSLSRRPYPPENEDEVEPILDMHPHDFLGLIQVDELIAESNETQRRDPSRKRRRNLGVLALRPTTDRGKDQTGRKTDDESVDVPQTSEEVSDDELIEEDTILTHEQTFSDMAVKVNLETQKDDLFFAGIINFLQTGQLPRNKDEARRIAIQAENFYIENDQLYHIAVMRGKRMNLIRPAFAQLCTPKRYRMEVLERYHNFGHVGFLKTYLTIKQVHFWPGMSFDVQHFIKTCDTCQRIKRDANAPRPKLTSLPVRKMFEICHIDHHEVRVANTSHGYRYTLIMTDGLTLNTELCAAKTTSAIETAQLFFDNYVCRYGCPKYVLSDRGQSFLAKFFQKLCEISGIQRINTSSFRPSTNSMAEMQCKRVVSHVRAFCGDKKDWPQLLPVISAAIRNSVVLSLGCSPFMALYGVLPRMSFEWDYFHPDKECPPKQLELALRYADKLEVMRKILQQNVKDCHETTERKYNKTARPQEFTEGMRVYLKVDHHQPGTSPKHCELYTGPFQILEIKNGILTKLQNLYTSRCLKNWIHVSKLRKVSDNRDILQKRFQTFPHSKQPNQETQSAAVEGDERPTSRQTDSDTAVAQGHRHDVDRSHATIIVEGPGQKEAVSAQTSRSISDRATSRNYSLQNIPDNRPILARTDGTRTRQAYKTVDLSRQPETANIEDRRSEQPETAGGHKSSYRPTNDDNARSDLSAMRSEDCRTAVSSSVNISVYTTGSSTSTTTTLTPACASSRQMSTHTLSPYARPFVPTHTSIDTTNSYNSGTTELTGTAPSSSAVAQQNTLINQPIVHTEIRCTPSTQAQNVRVNRSAVTYADRAKALSGNAASQNCSETQHADQADLQNLQQHSTRSIKQNNSERQTTRDIKSINGKRVIQKQAWYKVYFNDSKEPQWVKAQDLPTQLLLDYNAKKYKQKRRAMARRRRAFDQY